MIDLRSDTVTQPDAGMRHAMASAVVGDDVLDRDPTVERLQEELASLLGKEAALFVPSGTMANLIALRVHCQPGDEFICERGCHLYTYEQGGYAQVWGIAVQPVDGAHGVLRLDQVASLPRPHNEHFARTRLLTIENTHNRGGGTIQPWQEVDRLCCWAHENGLTTHMDGARLFHAEAATGIPVQRWAAGFDTVSICFSKGLGAPVGSALVGDRQRIEQARRLRKVLGGGMRQVGVMAAAALYALHHNRSRLSTDHLHAQLLAQAIATTPGLALDPEPQTNIVVFRIDPSLATAEQFVERLQEHGVLGLVFGPQRVRLVTHLNISPEDVGYAGDAIIKTAAVLARSGHNPAVPQPRLD
ncbi:MAG: low-specificity L-threonine aldolase [Pirellulaceae bacterium]|nr:MAG: low-specificity L-threonine aldolase [Pirellulaceae bacterium]